MIDVSISCEVTDCLFGGSRCLPIDAHETTEVQLQKNKR